MGRRAAAAAGHYVYGSKHPREEHAHAAPGQHAGQRVPAVPRISGGGGVCLITFCNYLFCHEPCLQDSGKSVTCAGRRALWSSCARSRNS